MRFDVDSSERTIRPLEVLLRALELSLAQPSGRDLADLLDADLDARREVLLPRADVDAEDAGVGVLGTEAVDGVGHPPLLADLLEEPRRGRSAEDRVEQRRGEAAAVGARDAGRAEAEVVLLGLLALEAEPGAGQLRERPADAGAGSRGRSSASLAALKQGDEAVVVEVPGGGDHDVAGRVGTAVVARERTAADRRDDLGGADDRPSERMVGEDGLREQVVHELLRRVLVHRDLLEHDLALLVDLGKRRREDHVGHDLESRLDVMVGNACVDDGVLAGGRRVELGTHGVERLRDLLRVEAARALEQEVLDEMRDACALCALVTGADVDPEPQRNRANAGDSLRDDALAAVELAQGHLLHCSASAPAKPAPALLSVLRRAYARSDRRRTAAQSY